MMQAAEYGPPQNPVTQQADCVGARWVGPCMVRKLDLHEDAMSCYCGSAVRTMGLNTQGALDPFRFVLIAVSGWMNHLQLQAIEYLRSGAGSIPCR